MTNYKDPITRAYETKLSKEMSLGQEDSSYSQKDLWVLNQLADLSSVLDVGCGEGRMYDHLTQTKSEIHGLDISETAIKFCMEKGYTTANVCYIDQETFPYEDNSFESAICFETLEHLVDPIHALAEINRVIKPEGLLGITCPNVGFFLSRIFFLAGHFTDLRDVAQPPLHLRFFTKRTLSNLLERTGFKIVKVAGFPTNANRLKKPVHGMLWALAKIRPSLFAPSLVLIAKKVGEPKEYEWNPPPHTSLTGLKWISRLWKST